MTRIIHSAVFALASALSAHAAFASPVDCTHSTIPGWIKVSGFTSNGTPDPEGLYCVTMRDFANNAYSGAKVILDFSGCCDINVCSAIVPGQTMESCTPPTFSAVTDALGVACFHVTGAARDNGVYVQPHAPNGPSAPCVTVTAIAHNTPFPCGMVVQVLAYDQNGAAVELTGPGVNTVDLSVLSSLVRANNLTAAASTVPAPTTAGRRTAMPRSTRSICRSCSRRSCARI